MAARPLRVSVIGCGNWGTAMACLCAVNCRKHSLFEDLIRVWCHPGELYEQISMVDWINIHRENKKYLPGIMIPDNVLAVSDHNEAVEDVDLLVIVLPHQYFEDFDKHLDMRKMRRTVRCCSLIKGLLVDNQHRPRVFSQVIEEAWKVSCSALSGANVATDIARGQFAESSLGYHTLEEAQLWMLLFHQPHFRVTSIQDTCGVQVCGAVKNVIALAAGFCDAMGVGSNTKAAAIRLGMMELRRFALIFFEGVLEETFLDSAGFADVITTCFGGRNVKCAAEFIRRGGPEGKTSWDEVEAELLKGQKLQGQLTCIDVMDVLEAHKMKQHFPLFSAVYEISFKNAPVSRLLEAFITDKPPTPIDIKHCTAAQPHQKWYLEGRAARRSLGQSSEH